MVMREATMDCGLAQRLTASLLRRYPWADQGDLSQDVFLTVFSVSANYEKADDAERGAISYQCAVRQVSRNITKAASPVSETWHRTKDLWKTKAVGFEEGVYKAPDKTPEELFEEKQLKMIVRRVALRCALQIPFGSLATRAVFREENPRDIAKDAGVNRLVVYRAVAELKRLMRPILEEELDGYLFCG